MIDEDKIEKAAKEYAEKNKKLRADNQSLKTKVNSTQKNILDSMEAESGKELIQSNDTNLSHSDMKNNNNANVISLEKKI